MMKTTILILLSALLLAGCVSTPRETPDGSIAVDDEVARYLDRSITVDAELVGYLVEMPTVTDEHFMTFLPFTTAGSNVIWAVIFRTTNNERKFFIHSPGGFGANRIDCMKYRPDLVYRFMIPSNSLVDLQSAWAWVPGREVGPLPDELTNRIERLRDWTDRQERSLARMEVERATNEENRVSLTFRLERQKTFVATLKQRLRALESFREEQSRKDYVTNRTVHSSSKQWTDNAQPAAGHD